jgi:putative transposase
MEVEEYVGAARHQRTPERVGQRNGYRKRSWDTRVGTVELKVPRVRDSGYFPSLLEPRRRAERAWQQWSKKPTSTASPPSRWTSW